MNLAEELRTLETPESTPDFTRGVMARIERIEMPSERPVHAAHRVTPVLLTLASVAAGITLILFSGAIASTAGPLGRWMAAAMPAIPGAQLGPIAFLAGLVLYFGGLWKSTGPVTKVCD